MAPEPGGAPFWIPNTDVLVNAAGEMIIKLELAGLAKDDVELSVERQTLKVSGQRPNADDQGAHYEVLEMHYGRFESVIEVPEEYDLTRANAVFVNGVVRLVVPRRTG